MFKMTSKYRLLIVVAMSLGSFYDLMFPRHDNFHSIIFNSKLDSYRTIIWSAIIRQIKLDIRQLRLMLTCKYYVCYNVTLQCKYTELYIYFTRMDIVEEFFSYNFLFFLSGKMFPVQMCIFEYNTRILDLLLFHNIHFRNCV